MQSVKPAGGVPVASEKRKSLASVNVRPEPLSINVTGVAELKNAISLGIISISSSVSASTTPSPLLVTVIV